MSDTKPQKVSGRIRLAFASGEIGDNVALNVFQFLIFTF